MDAAPKATLRSLNPAKGCGRSTFEGLQIVGPAVGERLLCECPDAFVRIQRKCSPYPVTDRDRGTEAVWP
jgi:hypothetical protein